MAFVMMKEREFNRKFGGFWAQEPSGISRIYSQLLFDALVNSYDFGESRIGEVLERMGEGVDMEVLGRLGELSLEAQKTTDQGVVKAREMLVEFFGSKHYLLRLLRQHLDPCPIFYGSVQYADPRNLDGDILVVARHNAPLLGDINFRRELGSELIDWWDKREISVLPRGEPHISYMPETGIQEGLTLPWNRLCQFVDGLPVVLSGRVVLTEDQRWLDGYRDRLLAEIHNYPVIAFLVNLELRECLRVRENRRLGLE